VGIIKFDKDKKKLTAKKLLQELIDRGDVEQVFITFRAGDIIKTAYSEMLVKDIIFLSTIQTAITHKDLLEDSI